MSDQKDFNYLPMKQRMERLLKSTTFSDCCFIFGDDGKQKLKAHKLILSAASSVFEAMFFGDLADGQPIQITDIQLHIFQMVLDFIYTDTCKFQSGTDEPVNLYYAADKYMIETLKPLCLAKIEDSLSASNACTTYEFAKLFKIENLMERAAIKITKEADKVLASVDFLNCQLSTVLLILGKESLSGLSGECDLFDAVVRWGSQVCKRKELQAANADLRKVLDEPLKKIRFLTFSAQQLEEKHSKSKILREAEFCALLVNIVLPLRNSYAIPEGFSNSNCKRNFRNNLYYSNSGPFYPQNYGYGEHCVVNGENYRASDCMRGYSYSPYSNSRSFYSQNSYVGTHCVVNDKNEATARIKRLLDGKKLIDSTFILIKKENFTGVEFSAHSLIISMGSPVFQKMLAGNTTNDGRINISDMEPHHFKLLLDYLYTDVCKLPESPNELIEFSSIAFKYGLPLLLGQCFNKMIPEVTNQNAFQFYETALRFQLPPNHYFYFYCLQFIVLQSNVVFKSPCFEDIQLETLLTILRTWQKYFKMSGTELFEAIRRWGRKECQRRNLPVDIKNLRLSVDPVLKEIHFLAFTVEDFAKGPGESQILTKDESLNILLNIANKNSNAPMPEGFSTVREERVPELAAKKLASDFPGCDSRFW